ncbi:hypothetical protein [Erythrobacter crassostreae]|uniref:Uncharacterized protein n=1 Tax=Erythrobacter crassostreae TaxID=2828328 RepID=A0A9X1JN51_9SPHN|nr:hypothetical protein [Erythrobacter crassostrea]MBV7260109.1 hypothetical protein [Erythrobacter crassostrea]
MLASPVAAQESAPVEQASAQQNLDCAIWASYQTGTLPEKEQKDAFAIALAWFIGLYEGETGTKIDDAMVERTAELDRATLLSFTPSCLERFGAFGERLMATSERIIALEK